MASLFSIFSVCRNRLKKKPQIPEIVTKYYYKPILDVDKFPKHSGNFSIVKSYLNFSTFLVLFGLMWIPLFWLLKNAR